MLSFGLRRRGGAPFTIDMEQDTPQRVSPEAFLEILQSRRADIADARFVPPKLGDDHFGYFEVKWKFPRFAIDS